MGKSSHSPTSWKCNAVGIGGKSGEIVSELQSRETNYSCPWGKWATHNRQRPGIQINQLRRGYKLTRSRKSTKAMDMRFYWEISNLIDPWQRVLENWINQFGGIFTKHCPPNYHRRVFLVYIHFQGNAK